MIAFLGSRNSDTEKALTKLGHTLLTAISREVIRADPPDSFRFQETILQLNQQLGKLHDSSDVYMIAAMADKALQEYNQLATKYFSGVSDELQSLAQSMVAAIVDIHQSGSQTLTRFKVLEEKLQKAQDLRSLHECRMHIGQCLVQLREEAQLQRRQTDQVISTLNAELSNKISPAAIIWKSGEDPVSGLPARHQAEGAIEALLERRNPNLYLVLFVIHHVDLLNVKYGYAVGDKMIREYLRHLMTEFSQIEEIYRWSGPAFLAIAARPLGFTALRQEVARIASHRLEVTHTVQDRSVLIPITSAAIVLPVASFQDLSVLVSKLDGFVKSSGSR